jgi:hypothetical protein
MFGSTSEWILNTINVKVNHSLCTFTSFGNAFRCVVLTLRGYLNSMCVVAISNREHWIYQHIDCAKELRNSSVDLSMHFKHLE